MKSGVDVSAVGSIWTDPLIGTYPQSEDRQQGLDTVPAGHRAPNFNRRSLEPIRSSHCHIKRPPNRDIVVVVGIWEVVLIQQVLCI